MYYDSIRIFFLKIYKNGDDLVFTVSEAAKEEIQKRFTEKGSEYKVRLQMRHSCFMKLKLTFEETSQLNDTEILMDGIHFIINKDHVHYMNGKKLDYIPDNLNFKQFDMI